MTQGVPVVRLRHRWLEEIPGSPAGILLAPLAAAYAMGVGARALLYAARLRRAARVGVPVISVGNLTAGGTGKTPLVGALCALLRARGERPCIVSRGYRAGPDGRNDEAQLLAAYPVVCDPDRVRGAREAIATHQATVVVLDDGFQHWRLHRDLDIVVLDALDPWGSVVPGGLPLPAGRLREHRGAIRRAGLVVLSRADLVPAAALARLERGLRGWRVPVVALPQGPPRVRPLGAQDQPWQDAPDARGASVVLASAIGQPQALEQGCARAGWRIACSLRFPDHHAYTTADVDAIRGYAQPHRAAIVVTGKDAVKLLPLLAAQQRAGWWELAEPGQPEANVRAQLEAALAPVLARPGAPDPPASPTAADGGGRGLA